LNYIAHLIKTIFLYDKIFVATQITISIGVVMGYL